MPQHPTEEERRRAELCAGTHVKARVLRAFPECAFFDLGAGVEGKLHVKDMSWSRSPPNLEDDLTIGDVHSMTVLEAARRGPITLAFQRTYEPPWQHAEEAYPAGKGVRGRVLFLENAGAIVELEPGIEAMLLTGSASAHVRPGEEIEATVMSVDGDARRIFLHAPAREPNPWWTVIERHHPGDRLLVEIVAITGEGWVVAIEQGITGLVPRARLAYADHPREAGAIVPAWIVSIDHDNRRILLDPKAP